MLRDLKRHSEGNPIDLLWSLDVLSSCRVLVAWSGEGQVVPPATACGVRTLVLGRGDLKEIQSKSSEALCKSKGNSFGFTWSSQGCVFV